MHRLLEIHTAKMEYINATTNPINTIFPSASMYSEVVTSSVFRYISILVLTLLLTIGLIAHTLAILATWKANKVRTEDSRHSLPSFLLTCLLRIDMLAVIFFFVRGFLGVVPFFRDHILWCDILISTNIFFTWSSGLANCLMCAERSASLIAPFIHRRYATLKKAKVTLFALQIFAFIVCLLPLFGFGTNKVYIEEDMMYDCVSPGEPAAIKANKFHIYLTIIFFIVGFSIIACILVCNVIIVYFIFHLKNKIAHLNASTIPTTSSNAQDIHQSSLGPTARKSSSETRFALIMILVSIAYTISWLPLYFVNAKTVKKASLENLAYLEVTNPTAELERTLVAFHVEQSEESKSVGIWIHVFNYVITPVIFVFFKKRNRAGLRLVCVDCCCCCCPGYRRRVKAKINISQFGSVVTENTLNRQQP